VVSATDGVPLATSLAVVYQNHLKSRRDDGVEPLGVAYQNGEKVVGQHHHVISDEGDDFGPRIRKDDRKTSYVEHRFR